MKAIPKTLAAVTLLALCAPALAQVCPPEAVDAWGRPDCVIGSVTITPGTGSMGFDSAPPATDPLVLTTAPPDAAPSAAASVQAPTSVPEPGSLALALLGAAGLAFRRGNTPGATRLGEGRRPSSPTPRGAF